MTWNTNMDEAPRGRYEKTTVVVNGKEIEREEFIPEVVWTASSCGKVIRTSYLPKQERWNLYTKDAGPIAWQPYIVPKHPNEE